VYHVERRGVNLVSVSVMKGTPDQHDPDWPKYPETVLDFGTRPAIEIDLRRIPSDDAVAALTAAGFGEPFAIMTAFDPRGKNLSREENEKRQQQLERRLRASRYSFVRVDACSPDKSHCECSVAIKIDRSRALQIAERWEQIAIFWWDRDRFWIYGAISPIDPPVALPVS